MASYRIFLTKLGSQNVIWESTVTNLELLAGMLSAGIGIVDDLNAEITDVQYYIDSDSDVSEFRLMSNVPEESLPYNSNIAQGMYGIWIKGDKRFHYNLYVFRSNTFFQGVVSLCNSFGVDFRNYIYGFPFDHEGKQYALSGYVMAPNQVGVDAPDIDDIEEEEEDDENIIEPLARTDEIITVTDEYIATPDETIYL